MATKQEVGYKKGDYIEFVKYESEQGEEAVLSKGDICKVTGITAKGELKVVKIDDEDVVETVFPEEVKAPAKAKLTKALASVDGAEEEEEEEEEEAEEEEETPPAKTAKSAKAKTVKKAAVEEDAEEAEEEVEDSKAKAKFGKAKRALPAEAEEEEAPQFADTATLLKIIKKTDAVTAARDTMEKIEEQYFTLGGLLSIVMREAKHVDMGYADDKEGISDFFSTEIGVGYRQARYYIEIYENFRKAGLSEVELAGIGWTKARLMTDLLPDLNEKQTASLLEKARKLSRDKFDAEVKKIREKTTGSENRREETVSATKYAFKLYEQEAEIVNTALQAAAEQAGTDDLSKAFALIVQEWSVQNENIETSVEDALKALMDRFGSDETVEAMAALIPDDEEEEAEEEEAEEEEEEEEEEEAPKAKAKAKARG